MIHIDNESQEDCIESNLFNLSSQASFVGRRKELAYLMNAYEVVKKGQVQVVLVSGEPGIGKTYLVNEFARRVSQDGAIVLRASTSDAEGMPFYLPFLEALGQYICDTDPDQLRKQVTPATQMLTSILPEMPVFSDVQLPSNPLLLEQTRFRLHKAVGEFLANIAQQQTLILVLDDLQWADRASLDLLCYITQHQTKTRLLILSACRDSDLNRNVLLERALTELTHQRILMTVDLQPLTLPEMEELALSILGNPISSDVYSLLYAQSEGNPFFVEELLQNWVAAGVIAQKETQWMVCKSHGQGLPPSIIGALRQRFIQLPPEIISYLRIAAIIGRTFRLSLLASVAGQEMEIIEEHLLEAEQAGFIRSTQTGVFTFCHDKIRACLQTEVSTSRRQQLHEVIGDALKVQYNRERNEKAAQFSQFLLHKMEESEPGQSVLFPEHIMKHVQQKELIEEAAVHYRIALELLPKESQRRGYLLQSLGRAESFAGHEEAAAQAYEEGLLALCQLGDVQTASCVAHCLGLARQRQGRLAEARAAMEYALKLLENRPGVETAYVLLDLSILLTASLEEQTAGQAYAQRSLEIAHLLEDTHLETLAMQAVTGNQEVQGSELVAIVQREEQAFNLAQVDSDLLDARAYCFPLAIHCYWLGELNRSAEISSYQIASMEYPRQPLLSQWLTMYSWPALLHASRGEWIQAAHAVEKAHTIIDHLENPLPLAFLQQIQGFIAYQQEDYASAENAFWVASRHPRPCPDEPLFFSGLLGLALVSRGKQKEARTYMVELEQLLSSLAVGTLPTAPIAMCMALLAIALEDEKRFADLYTRLLAFQGQHYWFLVDRVLGLLAALSGEREAAVKHLAAAEATAQREGLRPELARIYLAQAHIEQVHDHPQSASQAREMLKQAHAIFQELGMSTSPRQCCSQLRASSLQVPVCSQSAPQRPPAHLTWREVAVLKLVACGKSNNQIAQDLQISEKTVANHLTHIFNKTTCENRAAATAFAIRHGLV